MKHYVEFQDYPDSNAKGSGMNPIKTGTWVLVADSEKALFLKNEGTAVNPHLTVQRIEKQMNPPTRDQAADRPGKVFQSAGGGHAAYGDTDWHNFEKDRFATEIAEMLHRLAGQAAFERLVIVASPQVLGVMREALDGNVSDKVIAEIPKTLTNHPVDKIARLVIAELA